MDGQMPSNFQTGFGQEGYYDGFAGDAEKGGQPMNGGRKMSRIDRPITKSISGNAGGGVSDDDMTETSVSVGKQMELESGNSIKYRTCSWRKV